MADFYFITSVINMIWQIFTILFVLYRFTSFFNMLYNFTKFIGRLFKGLIYIKDQISLYITKHSRYSYVNENSQTTFQKLYNNIKSWFIKSPSTIIPLYETRESYVNNLNDTDDVDEVSDMHTSLQSSRNDTDFEYHLNNMLDSNHESTDFFKRHSFMSSSIYPPSKRPLPGSVSRLTDAVYEYSVQEQNNTKRRKSDEENILYTPVPVNTVPSNTVLLSPTPVKTKKDIFNSDFLVNFLNSKDNTSDDSNNKTEENELKMSLLNNSHDNFNFNGNLDDNDNIV